MAELLETDVMKCHKVSLSLFVYLAASPSTLYTALLSEYSRRATMPFHVCVRFSGMVYPLAWQALIDRILAVGRFIEEGSRRFLKSRMACTRARV